MADNFGFEPVAQQDDFGFQAEPKVPNTSGAQRMAQDNIAANDNDKAFEDIVSKPIQTPQERLNTAAGMPVDKIIAGTAKSTDINAANRGQYISALKDGSATSGSDWLPTMLHAVAPVASGVYNDLAGFDYSGAANYVGKKAVQGIINNPNPFESVAETAGKIPEQVVEALAQGGRGIAGRLAAPFISDDKGTQYYLKAMGDLPSHPIEEQIRATGKPLTEDDKKRILAERVMQSPIGPYSSMVFSPFAPLSPLFEGAEGAATAGGAGKGNIDLLNAALAIGALGLHPHATPKTGGESFPPGAGPWDNHPGAEPIKALVAHKAEIEPSSVTSPHVDEAIAQGAAGLLPHGKDFKDVETVTGGALKEETLHIIYKETGITPDQVFEDSKNDPKIAEAVADGKVPDAYEHLIEPKVFTPKEGEKLSVGKSDTDRAFNVVDADGEYVHGGFESAEEARHYIEDKKFEAEERAAIEAESKSSDGAQSIILGAEKITDKALAERKMEEPKKASVTQKAPDEGLFDIGAQKQTDLLDNNPHMVTHEVKIKEKELTPEQSSARKELEENSKKQVKAGEPPLAEGHVRLYRGESAVEGKGAMGKNIEEGEWYTQDRDKAEKYGNTLRYIDIPNTADGWKNWPRGDGKFNERVWGNPGEKPPSKLLKSADTVAESILPKELAGAKPRYGYGSKQFTLKFESDIDRSAYIAAQDVKKSKADSKYVDFLKKHGMSDAEIAAHGAKVKDAIKAMAKDAKAGELTIKSQLGAEPKTIEKTQKHLTKDTVPPSEVGKPTSLYTFIRNNGKIKPDIHDAGDLKDGDHGDLLSPTGKPADTMREMAKQNGYIKEGMSVPEFHDLLRDTNGGREHFRPSDADRILKAQESAKQREQFDPARIEHEAAEAGLDTEIVAGETPKERAKRLLNQLQEFYKNEQGIGRVRNEAGNWLLTKPIEVIEKFTGKLTGGFFQKLGEGYVRTFQPELMGDKALRTDAYMAKYKAKLQEAENSYYRQSAAQKKAWDKTSSDQRMQWLYDHETGRWNVEDDPDHARFQALLDATFKAEKEAIGADAETGYKQNYLPHIWEDAEGVKTFFNSDAMVKKYGKDGFTKASTFQLIQDGVRAGFKLKTDNPESMLTGRLLAGYNMIATMDLLKDMKSSGLATPAKAFSVDKRIGKLESDIARTEKKYKEAFEKKNPSAQTTAEDFEPQSSKLIQLYENRLENLKSKLEDAKAEKDSYKDVDPELKKNSFKVIGPDSKIWNIHNEVGPLWKNAMESKGLWENQGVTGDAYRAYMGAKSNWVAIKLGLSLFHPVHIAMINVASEIAGAADHLMQGGSFSKLAVGDVPQILGRMMGISGETLKGHNHPGIKAWNAPESARTPEQIAMVQRMVEGGFKPTLSSRDTVHFRENFDKAIKGLGANNLRLLGSALQLPGLLAKPFFEHWIPGMKAEIYLRQTEAALQRDPSLANDAGRRGEVFRQIAKATDRTYGEMNQDVQFWNPVVKDSFNAAFISGGWKLAQLYNAKGLLQPLKIAGKFAKTGEFSKADITYNMLQAYTYTGLTLATGAAINYMLGDPIGEAKNTVWDIVKNLVAPKTGELNPDGTPIRLNQPAFAKEAYMLARDINTEGLISGTGSFVYHTTLIPGIMNVLNNQDFTGRELISDPTDLNQWMSAGWDAISPISVEGYGKAEAKGSEVGKAAQILGFPLAGAYLNQTPFEQKVLYRYSELNPPEGDVYSQKLKGDLKSAIRSGDSEAIEDTKKEMRKEGIKESDIHHAETTFTKKFVDVAWDKLSAKDQKILLESASDEEKQKFRITGR